MHLTAENLTLAVVVVHLVASAVKNLVKKPAQKSQVDRIEATICDLAAQLQRGATP